eukprot:TRINITY_DN8273_c0_g1_i4.p1 TRINITY_DN8273_c0_g1~~TRINITY_DN8273_c0_g1_i4.p1  ORF type:complete len:359 (-),score=10.44 TRINITY_DN8273_c0_g1_i4:359-1435(-)
MYGNMRQDTLKSQWVLILLALHSFVCQQEDSQGDVLKQLPNQVDQNPQSTSRQHQRSNQESSTQSHDHAYVALCLIAKDENKFIREWIQYHKYIGVGKIYVFDHNSQTPLKFEIQDYIDQNLVTYRYITNEWESDSYGLNKYNISFNSVKQVNSPQRWVHTYCFLTYGNQHTFMGMIDIDEFIVLNQGKKYGYIPVEKPNLPAFLKNYEGTGGLAVYWRIFGSSGHVQSPKQGGVLDNYLTCESKPNTQAKHIVNTKYMGKAICVLHVCNTTVSSVNSQFKKKDMRSWGRGSTWEGININHYMFKSWEDYQSKRKRGSAHDSMKLYLKIRSDEVFTTINKKLQQKCKFMIDLHDKCCS